MNRRDFLTRWVRPGGASSRPSGSIAAAGLEPYTPDATKPWNAIRAGHLLRRATFMPRWPDLAAILAAGPSQAVDTLLNTASSPTAPTMANNMTESLDGLDIVLANQVRGVWRNDCNLLRQWYGGVIRDAGLTIAEKMTAFWSNHFATEFAVDDDYVIAPLLYRQNKLFRETGLANFKDLVMNVTLDGAMLVYLGGNLNSAGAPNENYGRELLELFTTGLGHYTEGDIKEAARVLTGWRVSQFNDKPAPNGPFNTYFDAIAHDINGKTVLGVSFPARDSSTNTEFLVRRDEVRKLIDTIFEKRGDAVARFVCRKLYRFFVYANPDTEDESVITAMADLFVQNDFEIKPVMAALLKSAHFFDNGNIGAQIKSPAEFEVGLARQLGTSRTLHTDTASMGQDLFDPPNVGGWTGHHDWITTTTYPIRSDISRSVVTALTDGAALSFITQFPDYDDVAELVGNIGAVMLPRALSTERHAALQGKLLAGAPDFEWGNIVANSPSTAARNLRDMLTTLGDLPDFQLC